MRNSIILLRYLFHFVGINVCNNEFSLKSIIRFIILIFLLITTIISIILFSYINRNQLAVCIGTIPYLGYVFFLCIILLIFFQNRKKIMILLRIMDDNVFTYTDEENISIVYHWLLEENNVSTINMLSIFYNYMGLAICGIPPIVELLNENMEMCLIYPSWVPWGCKNLVSFVATYIFQLLNGSVIIFVFYLVQCFYLLTIIEFLRQNEKICAALRTITDRIENEITLLQINSPTDIQLDRCILVRSELFKKKLCECIKHHQMIVKLFKIFESGFTITFSSELAICIISLVVMLYNMLEDNLHVSMFTEIMENLIIIASIFTRCFIGEIFSKMNERIVRTIFYEVKWYELDIKNRKLLSIFHSQVRRPFELSAFSVFKASFSTFGFILRTTYSFLNLFQAALSTK